MFIVADAFETSEKRKCGEFIIRNGTLLEAKGEDAVAWSLLIKLFDPILIEFYYTVQRRRREYVCV